MDLKNTAIELGTLGVNVALTSGGFLLGDMTAKQGAVFCLTSYLCGRSVSLSKCFPTPQKGVEKALKIAASTFVGCVPGIIALSVASKYVNLPPILNINTTSVVMHFFASAITIASAYGMDYFVNRIRPPVVPAPVPLAPAAAAAAAIPAVGYDDEEIIRDSVVRDDISNDSIEESQTSNSSTPDLEMGEIDKKPE